MRPSSIVTFDRLYLVATGLGLVHSLMSIANLQAQIASNPALRSADLGPSLIYVSISLSVAIPLLLWFLAAYRHSKLAMWILVGFTAISMLKLMSSMYQGSVGGLGMLVSVAVEALRVVALSFLFRPDAKAWFAGSNLDADAEG